MKRLSNEQILTLHSQLIEQTGGTTGVRDFNLLESAIETPFDIVNIGLHFFLKDVRPMLHPVVNHSTVVA